MPACKVCRGDSSLFAKATVLSKYLVSYFQCPECRFVQTESPYWLDEAYSRAIARADVGAVQRNLQLAPVTHALIQTLFPGSRRYLDFGGGYGLFVRMMRDRGFDFRWWDSRADALYCLGFEADPAEADFDLVTAFEVVEHAVEPLDLFAEMLRRGEALFFSTALLPDSNPAPHDWWYYLPSQGQHVSIFTREALVRAANALGVAALSSGSLHLFYRRRVSGRLFRWITRGGWSRIFSHIRRRQSLIPEDFEAITGVRLV